MTKITQTPVLTTATDNQTYLLVIDNGITKRFNYKAFGEQFSTISRGDIGYMGSRGNQGYSGSIGYQGVQGNTGYMGSQGSQGFQGYSGSIGYQGERGDTAYMGSRGSAGYFGSIGFTGSLGYFGSVGYVGSKGTDGTSVNIKGAVVNTINLPSSGNTLGDSYLVSSTGHLWIYSAASTPGSTNGFVDSGTLQGPAGYTGSFGSQGFQGDTGYTGSFGVQGYQGYQGYTGSIGNQGLQGFQGSMGYQGYAGSFGGQGFQGDAGYTGSIGTQGNQGYTGSYGYQGFQGTRGSDGSSVNIKGNVVNSSGLSSIVSPALGDGYISLSNGHLWVYTSTGSVSGFNDVGTIQGPQGNQGFQGAGSQGFQGAGNQGYQGNQGFQGNQGTQGAGNQGYQGYQGYQGAGNQGYQGNAGYAGSAGSTTDRLSTGSYSVILNNAGELRLPSPGIIANGTSTSTWIFTDYGDLYLPSGASGQNTYSRIRTVGSFLNMDVQYASLGNVYGGARVGTNVAKPLDIVVDFNNQATKNTWRFGTDGNLILPSGGDIKDSGTGLSVLGSSGSRSRTTVSGTTVSLLNNDSNNISITGFKSYSLLKVQTSAAAWVRLYVSAAARSADSSRSQSTDPAPGSGVIAEVITSGAQTQLITPALIGFNDDGTPSTTIYATVTNLSGSTTAITVTLTLLQLES